MRIINKINRLVSKFYNAKYGLKIAFISWVGIVCFFGFQLTKVKFDFDFESFFPVNHPDLEIFEDFKSKFNYDNDFLLIAVQNDGGIFNHDFLAKVENVTERIKNNTGTIEVISPTSLQLPVVTSIGLAKISVLHPQNKIKLEKDSIRLAKNRSYERYFFDTQLTSLVIRIKHKHFVDINESNTYVANIYQMLNETGITKYKIAGRTTVQTEFIGLIQSDFGVFIVIAFIIIILFLKWQYSSWKSVFIPILLIASSIIVTLGVMVFLGYSLNILTVLIPTIISFVAISDVIHFYTKHQTLTGKGLTKKTIIIHTVKEIGPATFLTSFTTAVGFISLATIEVVPIQLLGIYTALGVMIAFTFTFILLPFFGEHLVANHNKQNLFWENVSQKCFRLVNSNQSLIMVGTVIIAIFSVIGASKVSIDAYLLDDLPDKSFSKKSFSYLDQNHGGTKPWNLYIEASDTLDFINLDVLIGLEEIELYLANEYGLTNSTSLVSQIKLLNLIQNGGHYDFFNLPPNESELQKLLKLDKRLAKRGNYKQLETNKKYSKISGFIPEWGSKHTAKKDNDLLLFIKDTDLNDAFNFNLTGTTYLIDRSHEFLSKSLFYGLLFAFGTVALVSMFLFRSFKMLLITLIPNILPVLMTAAIIGYADIPIKLTTSIIFAVSFGIAVDDTIHFISRFRIESKKHPTIKAIENTFHSAGKAIIITTILLSLGFGIFCFSSFGASFFTGLFVVLTLISALLVDLLLLPVLLLKFYPEKNN